MVSNPIDTQMECAMRKRIILTIPHDPAFLKKRHAKLFKSLDSVMDRYTDALRMCSLKDVGSAGKAENSRKDK